MIYIIYKFSAKSIVHSKLPIFGIHIHNMIPSSKSINNHHNLQPNNFVFMMSQDHTKRHKLLHSVSIQTYVIYLHLHARTTTTQLTHQITLIHGHILHTLPHGQLLYSNFNPILFNFHFQCEFHNNYNHNTT